MACHNHPNAPTSAICNRCKAELCGICTQFLDQGEFCEKCSEAMITESLVMARSESLSRPLKQTRITKRVLESEAKQAARHDSDRAYIWLGVGGSASMIFIAMLLYAFPQLFEFDPEAAAARQAAQALEDCRLVFEEIGFLLEEGQLPDTSLRCAETNVPNIVRREGDIIRVFHPNPGAYGLDSMYVTSETHEVVLEARGGS